MSRVADQVAVLEEDLYEAREEVRYLNAKVVDLDEELEGLSADNTNLHLELESLTKYIESVDPDLITAWKALAVIAR